VANVFKKVNSAKICMQMLMVGSTSERLCKLSDAVDHAFDDIRPPTLTQPHCAVTHATVTQTNDIQLTECSMVKSKGSVMEYAFCCPMKLIE